MKNLKRNDPAIPSGVRNATFALLLTNGLQSGEGSPTTRSVTRKLQSPVRRTPTVTANFPLVLSSARFTNRVPGAVVVSTRIAPPCAMTICLTI